MIVVDASVVVAGLLVAGDEGDGARALLARDDAHAPHLIDVEVTAAIRRWVLSGRLSAADGAAFLADLRALAVSRHAHEALLDRVLELRDSVTAYDATYVALAELLDAPLATVDLHLTRAPGPRCPFVVPTA
ncbi:type II toxin-antitoxin system VapC family toxin [Geodermatophilus sp. SYSU D00691]